MELPRKIWILWLQGWDAAPWLQQRVLESWKRLNPGWDVVELSEANLGEFIDIPYLRDASKTISPQAKSDIIRLHLLAKHGGVWADATMLCMRPLDEWVNAAVEPVGMWMYHGNGGGMIPATGPASWFIISKPYSRILMYWRAACDAYWATQTTAHNYFWMDILFRGLVETDPAFRADWERVPNIYCETFGESNSLNADNNSLREVPVLAWRLQTRPPYALKFDKKWSDVFPDPTTPACRASTGYACLRYALGWKD